MLPGANCACAPALTGTCRLTDFPSGAFWTFRAHGLGCLAQCARRTSSAGGSNRDKRPWVGTHQNAASLMTRTLLAPCLLLGMLVASSNVQGTRSKRGTQRRRRQRSTQTPPAAGLSCCRSGTGFAGHRPVTAGWRRSPPVNGQPAPVTASRRRSPPANAREAPSCPPNPGFTIYLANFMRKIASEFDEKIM